MKRKAFWGLGFFCVLLTSGLASAQEAKTCTMTVLHPEQEGALLVEQSGGVSIPQGTLWVYSKHRAAVKVTQSAQIEVERVGLVGGAQTARSAKTIAKQSVKVTEPNDVYKELPDAAPADLARAGTVEFQGGDEATLHPGVYDSISVVGGAKIKLAPGIYIVQRKFYMAGSGALRGEGVTIINGGDWKMEASSELHLSAPREGVYKGIAFFQSRANTRTMHLGASAKMTVDGTVYLPNAPLWVANSAVLTCTNLSANTVQVSNSGIVQLK
jgi:hypothetical protein